ncbi:hypothetical protein LCGC14_0960810 [marine sediment metagenome]|uniref:ribonuclease H n=1 Tax=marine sediment metagenome TaxID=412755 RepID=A0A0F9NEI3_9ZZZZ
MEIYTDGACIPNPGKGGWGFVVVSHDDVFAERSGGVLDTTNNRMEFQAVIEALEWLEPDERVVIYSDSQLVVKVLNGEWNGKKNVDLVEAGRDLMFSKKAELEWIRGHAGNKWNEYADSLAEGVAVGL